MASEPQLPRAVRFGVFEADLEARELRKSGLKIKVHDQPFQVLAALLERPGEIVTREELQRRIWPADTFVDFDHSLNTAVNKLREALGDSADSPRFVETVPRRGYRFLGPVERVGEAAAASASVQEQAEPALGVTGTTAGRRRRRTIVWAGALATVGALVVSGWLLTRQHQRPPLVVVPLTTYPGVECCPSFSPDGNQVAFVWDGPKQDNDDIYVKLIGTENVLRLTSDPASESNPAWSPDGRSIAFLRPLWVEKKIGVFLVPPIGGPERKLAEIGTYSQLAWSPDGKWLAYTHLGSGNPADQSSGIYALSIETDERRRLTSPPPPSRDGMPAFSPEGRNLVFRRCTANWFCELYVQALRPDPSPEGKPEQVTVQGRYAHSPVWTPNGREIVYSSSDATSSGMWRVPVYGPHTPRRLEFAGDRAASLAISRQGNRLVYERPIEDRNIWRLELHGPGGKVGKPVNLISSTWSDQVPQYSPDGSRIAFISGRSGHNEVWICASDGSDPVQLTSMRGQETGCPRWSPDGQRIVFDSNPEGNFEIYVIDAGGGRARRLTNHPADDAVASFSRDGRWVYFTSSRTGRFEMWRMPAEGGEPTQLTRNGGHIGLESADGKSLYYAPSAAGSGLWRLPLDGGEEQEIDAFGIGSSLAVVARGIYLVRPLPPDGRSEAIEFFNFSTRKTTAVATTPRPTFWSMSVSPDERYLVYTQIDQAGTDLMLVENFR